MFVNGIRANALGSNIDPVLMTWEQAVKLVLPLSLCMP